jgi:Cytochrome C oxidase, cbb3-type, subunit III
MYDTRESRLAVVFFSFLLFFFAISSAYSEEKLSNSTLSSDSTYQKNCAKCHGKTAEGRHFGGPSLVSEKVSSASPDDLRNIIANGKGRMPKYSGKLSAEEINRLILQIQRGEYQTVGMESRRSA